MDGEEVLIEQAGSGHHQFFNVLSGSFELKLDLTAVDHHSPDLFARLETLCRSHLASPTNTHAIGDEALIEFFNITRLLEDQNLELSAKFKLVAATDSTNSLPTAVVRVTPLKKSEPVGNVLQNVRAKSREEILEELDDPEHFVFWKGLTSGKIEEFATALASATDERGIHAYLKVNPVFLVQPFRSGHGRWVYGSEWLGREHEVDFLVLTKDSGGFEWTMIELEPPNHKPFLKDGKPGPRLRDALHQIDQWRTWLTHNLSYARSPRSQKGLGLTDITSRTAAIIIIGREKDFPESTKDFRRNKRDHENIRIHSYDWLVREAKIEQ